MGLLVFFKSLFKNGVIHLFQCWAKYVGNGTTKYLVLDSSNVNHVALDMEAIEEERTRMEKMEHIPRRDLTVNTKWSIVSNMGSVITATLKFCKFCTTSIMDTRSKLERGPLQHKHKKEDFKSIKLISKGAFGSVHLTSHNTTNQRWAMKKINKRRVVQKKKLQQVYAERDIMGFTNSPYIVNLNCTFQTKSHLCLVMEYVAGGDLATLINNCGCLPNDMAKLYFAEAVLGVEYIHSLKVIHRDLKPDNILITAKGHVKIADFGLSVIGQNDSVCSQTLGTPDYLAPEVINTLGCSFASDWWSMGVVLYEVLVGMTPFLSTNVEDLFDEITDENCVIPWPDEDEDDIVLEAKDMITGLLRKNPARRLTVEEVKYHGFFDTVVWCNLPDQTPQFVPDLKGEDDTSYFDTREDRYTYNEESEEEDADDDTLQSSFSSW